MIFNTYRNTASQAYPVLQASLIILTESAVTRNASAHARWPMCMLGPESGMLMSAFNHLVDNLVET